MAAGASYQLSFLEISPQIRASHCAAIGYFSAMTTNRNSDDQDAQAPGYGTDTHRDHDADAALEPDSRNGTGAESDDDHGDDPITDVGPESPS